MRSSYVSINALAVLLGLTMVWASPLAAKVNCILNSLEHSTNRVINGVPVTNKSDFPFAVDLSFDDTTISSSRFCTGTLIKPNIVLTAAHCVLNDGYTSPVFATVGRIQLSDKHQDNKKAQTFRTIASIVNGQYAGLGSSRDVALLLLNDSSSGPTVTLAAESPEEEEEAVVVGYGVQKIGTLEEVGQMVEVMSKRLQKTTLRIKKSSFCDIPGANFRTQEGMLCTAGVKEGSSACKGDSGGGLFVQRSGKTVQVGVVSYGDSHCMSEESGVFTDVASVKDWIHQSSKQLQDAFHPTELFLDDTIGSVVQKGLIGRPEQKAFVRIQSARNATNVKLFQVRTNFSNKKKLKILLCAMPSSGATRLSMQSANGTIFHYSGSCNSERKSWFSIPARGDRYVVSVSSPEATQFKIEFHASEM